MYRFHRSLKIMIIDNILVDWQSSKKVISFPTLVISFVRSYQFSDTCHSNNSSHISDQCGQKKFIYFCWPIIFYSWYIFWYHMGLGTSKNIIIYLWFTLNVMYPKEACYTYQFCEIFSKTSSNIPRHNFKRESKIHRGNVSSLYWNFYHTQLLALQLSRQLR